MAERLGDKIERLRKEQGLSQKELSEKTGITEASMSRYINNARMPKTEFLIKIAEVLHTTTDYLLNNEANNEFNFPEVKILLARNAESLSNAQKLELINALLAEEGKNGL